MVKECGFQYFSNFYNLVFSGVDLDFKTKKGTCGTMRDFYKRRQREYWTDYLRRKKSQRLPRSWHRSESHYRYAYENSEK